MLKVADDDAESCRRIGEHGLELIRALHKRKSTREPGVLDRVNILTHCNAGWLVRARRPELVWVRRTRGERAGERASEATDRTHACGEQRQRRWCRDCQITER
jgi:hypothetical protein